MSDRSRQGNSVDFSRRYTCTAHSYSPCRFSSFSSTGKSRSRIAHTYYEKRCGWTETPWPMDSNERRPLSTLLPDAARTCREPSGARARQLVNPYRERLMVADPTCYQASALLLGATSQLHSAPAHGRRLLRGYLLRRLLGGCLLCRHFRGCPVYCCLPWCFLRCHHVDPLSDRPRSPAPPRRRRLRPSLVQRGHGINPGNQPERGSASRPDFQRRA